MLWQTGPAQEAPCLPKLPGHWLKGMGIMGPRPASQVWSSVHTCHCPIYAPFMSIPLVGPPSPHLAGVAGAGIRLTLYPFLPCPGAARPAPPQPPSPPSRPPHCCPSCLSRPLQGIFSDTSSSKTFPSTRQRRQFCRQPPGGTVGLRIPAKGFPLKTPGLCVQKGLHLETRPPSVTSRGCS